MKLAQLTETRNEILADLEVLAKHGKNFAVVGKPGTGKIYTIKELIPDVKTIEVHDSLTALDLAKAIEKAGKETVLLDMTGKPSPEVENIIKSALDGTVTFVDANNDIKADVGQIVISSDRQLPPGIQTRVHLVRF